MPTLPSRPVVRLPLVARACALAVLVAGCRDMASPSEIARRASIEAAFAERALQVLRPMLPQGATATPDAEEPLVIRIETPSGSSMRARLDRVREGCTTTPAQCPTLLRGWAENATTIVGAMRRSSADGG